jgi:hypothetical protein
MEEYMHDNPTAISEANFHEIILEEVKEMFYVQLEDHILENDYIEDDLNDLLEDAFNIFISTFQPERSIENNNEINFQKYDETDIQLIEDKIQKLKEDRLTKLFNYYSQEVFSGGIFNSDIMYSMLIDGIYPKSLINERIQESRYFKEKITPEFPAWLKVQSFDYTDDIIVDAAVSEMLRQFEFREVTEIGTMLHMFHLMFLMSSIDVIKESFDEVLEDCKKYLDDLLISNRLQYHDDNGEYQHIHLNSSAHGHGFWLHTEYKKHIDVIKSYIKTKQKEALRNNYPEFANEIMNALNNNLDEFKNLLVGDGSTLGKYANIDVLASIPYEDFVLSWLCRPYSEWDKIRNKTNLL